MKSEGGQIVKHVFKVILVLLLVLLTACSGESADDSKKPNAEEGEESLVIGVIPTMNQGNMQKAMNKLSKHLEAEIGIPVKIDVYPDYQGVVEAMNYGDVNMAYYGPLTYVIANHDSGAKAILTQLIDGEPFYYSYIITHKDSPLNSMEDIKADSKELTFAFGDPNSTSGSLIPSIALKKEGLYTSQNEHQFEHVVFTGGHDATAIAIENQQYDVGAIDSAIFNMLKENGKVGDNFKVIWKSEKLFQYPWAVKNVEEDLVEKIRNAFYQIEDEEILDAFGASGFTEANDEDYESIREAAIEAGRIK